MTRKKIVLISSGQPALNPRLVKEADALTEAGYDVTVLYQYWNKWGTDMDTELFKTRNWKSIRVGGSPHQEKATYWASRILQKISRTLVKYSGSTAFLAGNAIGRASLLLKTEALKHAADLYIAHNLPALPAAVNAARKNQSKSGFDAEDFHRNEVSDLSDDLSYKLAVVMENNYFPFLNYLSTASPLISERYKELYPAINPGTIRNVFPRDKGLSIPSKISDKLRLFWFSQTIGTGRGLEEIISAIGSLEPKQFQLHLLGNHDDFTIRTLRNMAQISGMDPEDIFFYEPVSPDGLLEFASQFDIGIACETGYPANRDICLTNKLFTYIQAGLGLVVSNTKAQKLFVKEYPDCGMLYDKNSAESLKNVLKYYSVHPERLSEIRSYNLELGKSELNWDLEKNIFLKIVAETLSA